MTLGPRSGAPTTTWWRRRGRRRGAMA